MSTLDPITGAPRFVPPPIPEGGVSPIVSPRYVFEGVRRPSPALLGSKQERDAFADQKLAEERSLGNTIAP